MFERTTPPPPADDPAAPQPPERVMRISPMDMRQQRFKPAMRGYDRTDVVAFLTEAADDYEHAMREIDRLRGDLMRMEALLAEHRERERNLRDTLLTAQRLSGELKESAHGEAKLIIREAQGRADLLLQKAQLRLEELDHDCNELKLRRRGTQVRVALTVRNAGARTGTAVPQVYVAMPAAAGEPPRQLKSAYMTTSSLEDSSPRTWSSDRIAGTGALVRSPIGA